jgi:hypothetical protein
MKVTFDSNVWQLVVMPEENLSEPDAASFVKIHAAILNGRLIPYLSETIFTLEGINKKDRKYFLGEYDPKVEVKERSQGNLMSLDFSLGPDEDAHPGNNEYLKKYLPAAVKLGFKIIHAPRIAGVVNRDVKEFLVKLPNNHDMSAYINKATEVGERIDGEFESGMTPLRNILDKYPQFRNNSFHKWISQLPASEDKPIAKAVAEWADGDSVAAHIGIGADYFCTRDGAKGAGKSSILSSGKVDTLRREFNFQKVTPAELADLL